MKRISMITGFLVLIVSGAVKAGSASAVVRAEQILRLGLPLNGVIASVAVHAGSPVKKGDELLRLDCRAYDIKRALVRARSDAAAVVAEKSKAELERTTEMYDQDLIADVEMQNSRDQFAEVDALYREAIAEQRLAELNREYCSLRSPADGVVLFVDTNPGDVLAGEYNPRDLVGILGAGPPVVKIITPDSEVFVIGQAVSVNANGKKYRAVVSRLEKHGAEQHVSLALPDAGELDDGQTVDVEY